MLNIIAEEMDILPGLVEKDYWIMHVLYGLKKQDFKFELKGGTSLSNEKFFYSAVQKYRSALLQRAT